MQINTIAIHTGGLDVPYQRISEITAKVSAATMFSSEPTIGEVNEKLQEQAASIYANAVIDVEYHRGMSFTSYKVLTATGTAVIIQSEDTTCPFCAETVKKLAIKCRHCGSALKN